jgi:iron complex outermembrane receptor protein
MQFKTVVALSALPVLCASASANAQQTPPPDTAQAKRTLPTVQVTASPVATDVRRIAQPTDVLSGAALRRNNAASLGESLAQMPGVRSLSMTTGIGKPVIRGLTNNRVVTLANGQRTETQQWGHDHSPNVESADAERIEVVKGPASVLHGSDALGGVVNVVRRALPVADSGAGFMRGRVALAYHSAAVAPSATLVAEGARGTFGWRASGTARRADNLRTPSGEVPNSTNRTTYGDLAFGQRTASRTVDVTASARDERIGIADDPRTAPGYTGHQRIKTERLTLDVTTHPESPERIARVHVLAGWEQNRRAEYASRQATSVDLGLRSTTINTIVTVSHTPVKQFNGSLGIALQHTTFRTFGTHTLIPDNTAGAIGVFAYEQRTIGAWDLSAGLRHDWRTLETPGNATLQLGAVRKAFGALTGTVGAVWRSQEPVSIAFNVARGFRAPSASDLFANGFHEGTRAFEIGNPTLRVESAINTDLALRLRHARVRGEVTTYVNSIRDYIYLAPVGRSGRALDSLQVVQGNARLSGLELSATVPITTRVTAYVSTDVVHAQNTSDGSALPFVPPMRAMASLRWDDRAPGRSFAIDGEWNARQTRTFRADYAPAAWSVLSASAGQQWLTPRGLVSVDLAVKNALNARYRDFMSRYKEFADAGGRAVVLRVSADW